ncbi:vWA domain-containing protein [Streptomyces europaeiscabiei]|uniref:vWA domain-containing protein n=1 Tax=Streptomyces europaeiscabiei TaxID=146819 RepID=UPI0038F81C65
MQLLPFYLVCDESGSMAGAGVDTLNNSLPQLHAEISTNPTISDKTRFCLMGFSTTAAVLQPMADLGELDSLPALSASGVTSYGAAFRLLKDTIEQDVTLLKSQGHQVYRPVVFFLSDGNPTDPDWHTSLRNLNEFPFAPKIIAFGVGDAAADVLAEVANFKAFIQKDTSVSPATALREFAASLTRSIVTSSASISSRDGQGFTLQVDDQVPGFSTLSLDKL